MAVDPLDRVLRLVAEGRLTAEEAAPILDALDDATSAGDGRSTPRGNSSTSRGHEPADDAAGLEAEFGTDLAGGLGKAPDASGGSPSSLRIEVRDAGRQVVNLRLPIAVGRFALDRVPGLSGEQVDRVREAMRSGFRGPVLVVDEGDSGVRIVLE